MGVDHGGFDDFVSEEFLYGADVVAVLEEVGGKTVSEGVGGDGFDDLCFWAASTTARWYPPVASTAIRSGSNPCICSTSSTIPAPAFSTCFVLFSPNTATSNLSFDTSTPTNFPLLVVICLSNPYNGIVPALVFGHPRPTNCSGSPDEWTWRSCCTTVS